MVVDLNAIIGAAVGLLTGAGAITKGHLDAKGVKTTAEEAKALAAEAKKVADNLIAAARDAGRQAAQDAIQQFRAEIAAMPKRSQTRSGAEITRAEFEELRRVQEALRADVAKILAHDEERLRRFDALDRRLDDFETEYRDDFKALAAQVAGFGGEIKQLGRQRRGPSDSHT